MLQHTGLLWSRTLQLNFTCFAAEIIIEGTALCDAADIKNVADELKWLSQNNFHECFQRLCQSLTEVLVAQGDYFEGNVVRMILLFRISHK
jgi:hypothetical protein